MKMLFTLIFAAILLTACANPPQRTPTPSMPGTPTQTATTTPLPTVTPRPTSTVYVYTPKPHNTPTETPAIPTRTPYILPTNTPGPSPTPTATIIPISASDDFWLDLQAQEYTLFSGSSTVGPGGYIYSAYIFLDSTFWAKSPPMPYREAQDTEGCRIAFYRWDGEKNVFLYSFPGVQYTDKSVYGMFGGYPISCVAVDWENPFTWSFFGGPTQDDLNAISASGAWSDVNQNGNPEFAVLYRYCSNGCLNYGVIAVHLYEIQTTSKVVDLTANLPGVIEPIKGFVHSTDPLDFYIYDPTLEYCYKWCTIETFWIYAWDGEAFIDVTPKYADEYRKKGETILASLKEKKAVWPREFDLLEILFLYEKAGLRREAVDIFLEITDLSRWPNAIPDEVCWLQFARASIQEDFGRGRPFQFPAFDLTNAYVETSFALAHLLPKMDTQKYDLSACIALLPTPQP
ncbi:MAG: hypothetical protein HUU38_06550 [Anaerolineales bacterium]|nr:hypothetical protein [Anaerolineales bacterium]